MNFLISDAWAQAGASSSSGLVGILPMVLIFVIFYFLLIRPQQKRAKEHKAMVAAIAKGDEIVTNGGALGKVIEVDDNFVTVEIAAGVNIKVQRMAIAQMMPKGTVKS
jgi:preprotein translocase subunit YajC